MFKWNMPRGGNPQIVSASQTPLPNNPVQDYVYNYSHFDVSGLEIGAGIEIWTRLPPFCRARVAVSVRTGKACRSGERAAIPGRGAAETEDL